MTVLQMVERPSADGVSTRVEAVPNPEQTASADFKSGEGWPFLTGATDILRIASSFAAEGFDVRNVTLIDRFFTVADEDSDPIVDAVTRHIQAGQIEAAIATCRSADLFVEQVKLFHRRLQATVDIRQNGVILAKGIDADLVDKVLNRTFDVQ